MTLSVKKIFILTCVQHQSGSESDSSKSESKIEGVKPERFGNTDW